MTDGSASEGDSAKLRLGFTIGDVRVVPGNLELSNEDGARTTISSPAMELLLLLAQAQPASVSREKAASRLGLDASGGDLEPIVTELESAIESGVSRPGYLEVFSRGLRLMPRVELAGHGRFTGLITLWEEIRKRRVFRVATTYAILTFIILQIADAVLDTLPVPPGFFSIMLAALAIGFPVVILLAWFFEITPQGIFLDRRQTSALMNRPVAVIGIVFLGGIALGFAFAIFEISDLESPTAPPDDLSIAVLPFDNLTGNPEDRNISDGIVEELLNALAGIKELRVVGRKASFYFRDREEDWQTIADTLGANMIIEGSIRRNEDKWRVAAQLIDRAGIHLWSNTFDAPIGRALDILEIQRNIALQVAAELPIELSEESRAQLASVPTMNEQAYQLYLQGRNYLRDADQMQRFKSAEQLFSDALEADPYFVDALSGLCETQALIYQRTERPTDYARAAATCSRLISVDELNVQGFVALGTLNRLSGNYAEAQTLFEKALDLDADFEPAMYGLARSIEGQGRYDEAEQYYLRSLQMDPGYWRIYIGYGRYLERGGHYAEAIEQYQKVVRLAPDNVDGYTNLGAAYFDNDQWDEALEAWERAVEIDPDPIGLMNVGTAQYYLGDYAAAEASFRAGIDKWDEFYPLWGKLGAVLERLNREDEAEAAFENAVEYASAVIAINDSDARAMYYLASFLAHLGRHDEARAWSERALAAAPGDPAAHYFAAVASALAGDDEATVNELAEALTLGYSERIIRADPYFQPHLDSATLQEILPGSAP